MKKSTGIDFILIGFTMIIGIAEVFHLAAVVLGWSFSRCSYLFAAASLLAVCVIGIAYGCGIRANRVLTGESAEQKKKGAVAYSLSGLFLLLLAAQIVFLIPGLGLQRQGDMVLEVANSFLTEDAVYTVNPMTGRPYTAGMPMRLQILCLPSFYGFLCKVTGVSTSVMIHQAMPVIVLMLAYGAFASLGKVFFSGDVRKRRAFLLVTALLFWAGAYGSGMDGFGLLCCGWSGVTIRNTVLLPWLFSLIMRKKWFCVILCILAEACITWTLYGAGAGVLIAVGMILADFVGKKIRKGFVGEQTGKEEAR